MVATPTFKMKAPNVLDRLDPFHGSKKEREKCLSTGRLAPFLLPCLCLTTILSLFLYFPNPFEAVSKREIQQKGAPIVKPPEGNAILNCNLYEGRWIQYRRDFNYKNSSCIPEARNCFLHGRTDRDFLNWRWKPYACNLPKFDPKIFLDMVRGNKMAFIGDSVSMNQVESLVCLLSKIYLYKGDTVVGCVDCEEPNVTKVSPSGAIQMALRTALVYINGCKECRGIVTVVRTFSPTHFEHGSWDTGGICNRTKPSDERQIIWVGEPWNIRKIQVEETERMGKEGKEQGKSFVAMDVTKAMLMRPDGHPGDYWGNLRNKDFRDCLHWCLPGPIDTWNEFLMAILEIETGLVS